MITLNLTDREAAILYLKFDLFTKGNEVNKDLDTIFEKLEQMLLINKRNNARKELRFNILTEFQISQPANLRR